MQRETVNVIVPAITGNDLGIRTRWCAENIGRRVVDWDVNSNAGIKDTTLSVFYFVREKDALLFSLRWSGMEV